ncbi:MAG: co-chaperone DjlA [Gammaproteobacteria bacterium]|nr:co-chaperone DjlA [Gammaproteobacteria bacterium]
MSWTGKLIGGLLGLLVSGPFGAAVGALLGHQYDLAAARSAAGGVAPGERFFQAVFQVMGHVAKADGRVSEREIDAARRIMQELRLSEAQTAEAIRHFTLGKQPDFGLDAAVLGLRRACAGRPDLLRVFMEVELRAALAGNDLAGPSRPLLQRIAGLLRISGLELAHMEALLRFHEAGAGAAPGPAQSSRDAALSHAYSVLQVESGASDAAVQRAYRRQLSRHHPDKLKANGLPDSMLEHAKQRTQQIIEAWELIRAQRGL